MRYIILLVIVSFLSCSKYKCSNIIVDGVEYDFKVSASYCEEDNQEQFCLSLSEDIKPGLELSFGFNYITNSDIVLENDGEKGIPYALLYYFDDNSGNPERGQPYYLYKEDPNLIFEIYDFDEDKNTGSCKFNLIFFTTNEIGNRNYFEAVNEIHASGDFNFKIN